MSAVPVELSRDTLLAFRNRRWDLVREAKESFWAEETRTRGPAAGFDAGEAMWTLVPSTSTGRARRHAWPTIGITSRCPHASVGSPMPSPVIGGPGLEEIFLAACEQLVVGDAPQLESLRLWSFPLAARASAAS